jgi:uncharacterized protein (TIGR00255 family)
MTAFSRQETQSELGSLVWEIRTVNHRYLEVSVRLDESFRALEMPIRKRVAERLARGKVEVNLRYQPPQQSAAFNIDQAAASAVIKGYETLAAQAQNPADIDMLRVMQWPGVVIADNPDQQALHQQAMDLLNATLDDLVATRAREGQALEQMILQRADAIEAIANETQTMMPNILQQQKQKLLDRVADLQASIDAERLEQEIALLAQKADVAEELDRLNSHVTEVRHILTRKEPVGRRLDFLMQELNREANTLGSKSIDIGTTRHSVDLKVLIEQMREQIQNIE